MDKELKTTIDELGVAFAEFKAADDLRYKQIIEDGKATDEIVVNVQKVDAAIAEVLERLSKVEAKANTPLLIGEDGSHVPEALYDHEDAFDDWLRHNKHPETIRRLEECQLAAAESIRKLPKRLQRRYKSGAWMDFGRISEPDQSRAITITTTGGGNAIPTLVSDRIVSKIYDLSPIRQVANVQQASNENHRFIALNNNSIGGWVGAGGARSETTTPVFHLATLTYGTAYAYPFVQEEAVDDLEFDVASLVEDVSTRVLAQQEGVAFVTGNGTDKPTGFLDGTPVTTADEGVSPERAFQVLQYFPTGAAAAFQQDYIFAPSPVTAPEAVLIDTMMALKAGYRANAVWVMNKATLGVIRKLRDANGNLLWVPGLAAGQPNGLLGYPILEAEAMPDIGANTFPIAFGDFNEGYQIGDIVNTLRITVDDNITAPGNIKFYIRRRLGGNKLNDDAIKLVKVAAS